MTLPLGGETPLVRALHGNGKLAAKDGALTNVDLISKVQLFTGILGLPQDQRSGATTFKTLESDFVLGGGIADIKRLFLLSPLMEASGGGKMTLTSPSLEVSLEVALAPSVSARASGAKAAAFFKDGQGRIVVPLKITGPVKGPSVNLDSEKLIRKGTRQLFEKGPGQLFERLFKPR